MLPSGRVLRSSYKKLMLIDGLLNENFEFKKRKTKFQTVNLHTLSHSLTP